MDGFPDGASGGAVNAYRIRRQWLPCEIEARYSDRSRDDLRAAIARGCGARGNTFHIGAAQ